jgi:hypothetical protein
MFRHMSSIEEISIRALQPSLYILEGEAIDKALINLYVGFLVCYKEI